MNKILFFIVLLTLPIMALCQKLSLVTGLNLQYGSLSKAVEKRSDIKMPYPKFYATIFYDINYKPQKLIYSLSLKTTVLGNSFRVKKYFYVRHKFGLSKYYTLRWY